MYDVPSTHLTHQRLVSPKQGAEGSNTCLLLLLLFAIHTFSAQNIRGLQLLKGRMKLLADRGWNTREPAAHEWGFLLAISMGAELSLSGEGTSLLLAQSAVTLSFRVLQPGLSDPSQMYKVALSQALLPLQTLRGAISHHAGHPCKLLKRLMPTQAV